MVSKLKLFLLIFKYNVIHKRTFRTEKSSNDTYANNDGHIIPKI